MKLRMYLRGLGIGIVVTALIMGLTTSKVNKVSDSEIIKRAEALGMVKEDNVLKSVVDKNPEESKPAEEKLEEQEKPTVEETKPSDEPSAEENTEEMTEDNTEEFTEDKEEASEEKPEEEITEEEKSEDEKPEENKPAETAAVTTGSFTLEIAGGSGSEQVSTLLEKGGAVKSAADFDKYLCDNGYDHRITTGKHVIPAGSDYETIAKIITSR